MSFTLEQLRAFELIVRLGTFHAAGESLGISQPSVSQRIRELELATGTRLFERRGPRINLTADGHALIEYARRMLRMEADVTDRFRRGDPLRGVLRLGTSDSFALVCLADLVKRLESRYPHLEISIQVHDTRTTSRMLNARELDIAIVSEPDVEPHVVEEVVGYNQMAWLARAGSGPAGTELGPEQLAAHHLMVTAPPSRLHDTVMRWFAEAGVAPPRVSTCNNLSVLILAVLEGVAIGVAPLAVVRRDIAEGRLRPLPVAPALRSHRVSICHQAAERGPGVEAVIQIVRRLISERDLFMAWPATDPA